MLQKSVASSRKTENDVNAVITEQAIVAHFNFLHGYLQMQEKNLLVRLKEAQNRTASSLQNVMTELEISIKVCY